MAKKHTTLHSIINELVDRTNTDTQRIRQLESWEKGLDLRLESLESDVLNLNNSLQKLSADLETGFKKRDQEMNEIRNTIKEIIKQLKRFVRTEKLGEIQALLDIYNPLKSNFVTREEVEQMISERLPSRPGKNK